MTPNPIHLLKKVEPKCFCTTFSKRCKVEPNFIPFYLFLDFGSTFSKGGWEFLISININIK